MRVFRKFKWMKWGVALALLLLLLRGHWPEPRPMTDLTDAAAQPLAQPPAAAPQATGDTGVPSHAAPERKVLRRSGLALCGESLLLSSRDGTWPTAVLALLQESGIAPLPVEGHFTFRLPIRSDAVAALEANLQAWQQRLAPYGISVQANPLLYPASDPNDPRFAEQWSLPLTNAPAAWAQLPADATHPVVAVIDSGVDVLHPDFSAADGSSMLWRNPSELPDNGVDDDLNGLIDDTQGWDFYEGDALPSNALGDQHGTRMAGIIGAARNNAYGIAGLHPGAALLPLRVGSGQYFDLAAIVSAIDYAISLRNRGVPLTVLSNSYGALVTEADMYSTFLLLYEAIERAQNAGLLFVAAAGNSGRLIDPPASDRFIPAGYPLAAIVSVAASTQSDALRSSSNYGGSSVDLAAPGESILSTAPNASFVSGSGTSEACAFVSGAAALAQSLRPDLDALALKQLLMDSGQAVAALASTSVSGKRIDLAAALSEAARYPSLQWQSPMPAFAQADWPLDLSLQVTAGEAPLLSIDLPIAPAASTWHFSNFTALSLTASASGDAMLQARLTDQAGRSVRTQPLAIAVLPAAEFWLASHFPNLSQPLPSDFWTQAAIAPGVAPLTAMAFGWNPLQPAPAGLSAPPFVFQQSTPDGMRAVLSFPLAKRFAAALQVQVFASTDLQLWTALDPAQYAIAAEDAETRRMLADWPMTDATPVFFRLRIERTP